MCSCRYNLNGYSLHWILSIGYSPEKSPFFRKETTIQQENHRHDLSSLLLFRQTHQNREIRGRESVGHPLMDKKDYMERVQRHKGKREIRKDKWIKRTTIVQMTKGDFVRVSLMFVGVINSLHRSESISLSTSNLPLFLSITRIH